MKQHFPWFCFFLGQSSHRCLKKKQKENKPKIFVVFCFRNKKNPKFVLKKVDHNPKKAGGNSFQITKRVSKKKKYQNLKKKIIL
jgi:GTP-dependent phosphoenolpyruvate carboxykinase